MKHHVVKDYDGLVALKPVWKLLLEDSGEARLPLTWEWFNAWWRWFGQSESKDAKGSLRVHWFESPELPLVIFPLYATRGRLRKLPVRFLRSMANGHSPYWDAIVADEFDRQDLRAAFQMIVSYESTDIVSLERLAGNSRLRAALIDGHRVSWHVGEKDRMDTPIVDTTQSWEEYFASRPRKFRQNLNRKLRALESDPALEVEHHALQSGVDPAFDEAVMISRKSWKVNVNNDLGSNRSGREFLRQMIDDAQSISGGGASVWICRRDNIPIAYEMHLRCGGVTFPIRADYDERFKKDSPGSLTEFHALRAAFENTTIRTYDSCADDYPYLRNLTDVSRETSVTQVFSSSVYSRLLWILEYRFILVLRKLRWRLTR